jgi:hypothetical protein
MTLSRVRAVNLTAVLGLRSRHAGDRDGTINRTASDTATGYRFGDFPADGGVSFDQRSGDANGADLVGLGVNDETPVKKICRTGRISQQHARRLGCAAED